MNVFEVLAEPIRRRIVETLASGEHCTADLEALITLEFGVGKSAVHHHLAYLRRVDWVIVREEWPYHWYRLEESVIPSLESAVRRLRRRWNRRIGTVGGVRPALSRGRVRSKKGRRGRGADPDDPWWNPEHADARGADEPE